MINIFVKLVFENIISLIKLVFQTLYFVIKLVYLHCI